MNTRKPQIPNYSNADTDYTKTIGTVVGVCEIKGRRAYQEDAIAVDNSLLSSEFVKLNAVNQAAVMKNTYEKLQTTCGLSGQGSCMCTATGVVQGNQGSISTSFVGDSVSFLIILDRDGNLKKALPCNPDLHDGNNPKERKAIEEGIGRKEGFFLQNDLAGPEIDNHQPFLAVTRAIGDMEYDNTGISHEPEIIRTSFTLAEGDTAFMVIGCDGIMEHLKGQDVAQKSAREIGAILQAKIKENTKDPALLAEAIVANAIRNQSRDNITAIVVPLINDKPAISASVMDGHGGPDVSKAISEKFSTCFAEALLEKKLELEATPEVKRPLSRTVAQKEISIPAARPPLQSTAAMMQALPPARKPPQMSSAQKEISIPPPINKMDRILLNLESKYGNNVVKRNFSREDAEKYLLANNQAAIVRSSKEPNSIVVSSRIKNGKFIHTKMTTEANSDVCIGQRISDDGKISNITLDRLLALYQIKPIQSQTQQVVTAPSTPENTKKLTR